MDLWCPHTTSLQPFNIAVLGMWLPSGTKTSETKAFSKKTKRYSTTHTIQSIRLTMSPHCPVFAMRIKFVPTPTSQNWLTMPMVQTISSTHGVVCISKCKIIILKTHWLKTTYYSPPTPPQAWQEEAVWVVVQCWYLVNVAICDLNTIVVITNGLKISCSLNMKD